MYTIFAQSKYAMDQPDAEPIGYELFVRRWDSGRWVLPDPFDKIGIVMLNNLLRQTIAKMPDHIQLLSFNLEQNQFVDPAYAAMVASVQQGTSIRLVTELTERLSECVKPQQLLDAAKRFTALGLEVCIDDVGTGQNSPALVTLMNDYVNEYKFAFQNFRPASTINELGPQLRFWTEMAQHHNKILAWEGIESGVELALLSARYPGNLLQGFLFSRPMPIPGVAYEPQAVSGE